MNKPSEPLGLRSPDGREAQLVSVQIQGEVLGLLLRLTVRQTWRNTSGAPMATRLTLALTPEQHLLDLQAEHNGESQKVSGLLRSHHRLCSAALGTLHTGQQLTVQWRLAQLLHLDGGSLRLQLPASLAPQALRPARISIELHDALARGTLGSCSHEWQKIRHANGLTLRLLAPGGLDRDLGLSVHGLREMAFAIASPDPSVPAAGTLLASRSLTLGECRSKPRLRVKLLVDHSGAIASERQSQIQMALERLLADLQPQDQLSISRLEHTLVHDLPRLQPCTEAYVRRARALMRHHESARTSPDWASVLQAMVDIRDEDEEPVEDASILLITGQPLPDSVGLLPILRQHVHRLHVMTVGDDASQSDWPRLALLSDGRSEPLGSGQHCLQALQRLFDRMRSLRLVQAQLSLQGASLEQPRQEHGFMAEGDTLHLWARYAAAQPPADLTGCPQWQAAMAWHTADGPSPTHSVNPMFVLWDPQGDVHRLCNAQLEWPSEQLPESAAAQHAVPALKLSLADAQAQEAETAKTALAPALPTAQTLSQTPIEVAGIGHSLSAQPSVDANATIRPLAKNPASQSSTATRNAGHPMAALVHQFNQQAAAYTVFRAALAASLPSVPTRQLDGLVMQLARKAGNPARVWAMLLYWLHTEQSLPLKSHALALVEQELANLPVALRSQAHALFASAVTAPAVRQAA